MEKAVAAKVMEILADGSALNALDALAWKITDEAERQTFRRKLGDIMALYTDPIVSVAHQYPDLDPDCPPAGADDKPA